MREAKRSRDKRLPNVRQYRRGIRKTVSANNHRRRKERRQSRRKRELHQRRRPRERRYNLNRRYSSDRQYRRKNDYIMRQKHPNNQARTQLPWNYKEPSQAVKIFAKPVKYKDIVKIKEARKQQLAQGTLLDEESASNRTSPTSSPKETIAMSLERKLERPGSASSKRKQRNITEPSDSEKEIVSNLSATQSRTTTLMITEDEKLTKMIA